MGLKPPRYVSTVQQLIFWHYAQLIARAAGFEDNYGFVVSRYQKLDSGEMEWSSTDRDWEKERGKSNACIYCGAAEDLTTDHIIPVSRVGVDSRIARLLTSSNNCVCACRSCNASKGDRDIFEWYGQDRIDDIPKLALSKFLKLAYELHEIQGTLALEDPNMDGILDIYDLGVVITHLIRRKSSQAGQAP